LQCGLGAYAFDHERQTLLRQLDARAGRLANVREALPLCGDSHEAKRTAQWLGTTLLDQNDVLFCEVTDSDGQMLFRGGNLDAEPCRRYTFPLTTQDAPPGNTDGTAENNSPATATPNGTLYLALSTADIEAALGEARGTLVAGILAGAGFVLFVTVLIVRYTIGNTVTRMLKSVKKASLRHYNDTTMSRTDDALEQLGAMLDTLTTELQEIVEKEKRLTAETMVKQGQYEQTVG